MTVTLIYKNGVFVPVEKLDLAEHTQVTLELPKAIESVNKEGETVWDRHGLKQFGYMAPDFKELGEEWNEYMP